MKTLVLKIEGMRNSADARTLQSALSEVPGVETAAVSFEDREIRVQLDSNATDESRLAAVVQRAGYQLPESCP